MPKGIIYKEVIQSFIINGKIFMTNPLILIWNDRKEIRKLTRRQGEDYTTVCLFDYDYIKNRYRLIAVDSTRKK